MKIGMWSLDSKWPNLALMKLSTYHKARGDDVEIYSGELYNDFYDKVYISKVFKGINVPGMHELPTIQKNWDIGGSGYDLVKTLPDNIEHLMPDYSLYNCNYSLGFTTRGCFRHCEFCIVPSKEGKLRRNADIYEFWDRRHKKIMLLDNNLLGLPEHFFKITEQIQKENLKVDFNQGLDIRIITEPIVKRLSLLKTGPKLRFAWDNPRDEMHILKGIKLLLRYIRPGKLMFFVLVGFNSTLEEDLHRIKVLRSYKIDPFVMVYNRQGNISVLSRLGQWNNRYFLKNLSFFEFLDIKGYQALDKSRKKISWRDLTKNNTLVKIRPTTEGYRRKRAQAKGNLELDLNYRLRSGRRT